MDIYPNITFLFQIANFLILLFILNIILYKPIRKILGQRGNEVISFQEMIEDFQNRSEKESKALEDIPTVTAFLAPLSREEILFLKAPERRVDLGAFLTDVMRRKLLRRTRKQKGILSLKDLENIERRATSAYREMQLGWQFDYVIPNHDGEDSENWSAFYYSIGDARRALVTFAFILSGQESAYAERWDQDLLP